KADFTCSVRDRHFRGRWRCANHVEPRPTSFPGLRVRDIDNGLPSRCVTPHQVTHVEAAACAEPEPHIALRAGPGNIWQSVAVEITRFHEFVSRIRRNRPRAHQLLSIEKPVPETLVTGELQQQVSLPVMVDVTRADDLPTGRIVGNRVAHAESAAIAQPQPYIVL